MAALSQIPSELFIKVLDFVGNPHTSAPVSKEFQEKTRASWICNALFVKTFFPDVPFDPSEADPLVPAYNATKQRIAKCGLVVPEECANNLSVRTVVQLSEATDRVLFFMKVADRSELAKAVEKGDEERDVLKRSASIFQWMTTYQQHLGEIAELHVEGFDLAAAPEEIRFFVRARTLRMQANKLTRIPSYIAQFPLTYLDLSENQLRQLPSEIGQLGQLQQLYVQNNQLRSLPEEMTQLAQLQRFYAWNNPGLALTAQMTTFLSNLDLVFIDVSVPRSRLAPLAAHLEARLTAGDTRELSAISYQASRQFADLNQRLFAQQIGRMEIHNQINGTKAELETWRVEREAANRATAEYVKQKTEELAAERVRGQAAEAARAEEWRRLQQRWQSSLAEIHATLARTDPAARTPSLNLAPIIAISPRSEEPRIVIEAPVPLPQPEFVGITAQEPALIPVLQPVEQVVLPIAEPIQPLRVEISESAERVPNVTSTEARSASPAHVNEVVSEPVVEPASVAVEVAPAEAEPAAPATLWQQAQAFFAALVERIVAWLRAVEEWANESD